MYEEQCGNTACVWRLTLIDGTSMTSLSYEICATPYLSDEADLH